MQGMCLQFLCFVCFERRNLSKGIFYNFDIFAVTSKYFEFLIVSCNRSSSGLFLLIKVDFFAQSNSVTRNKYMTLPTTHV